MSGLPICTVLRETWPQHPEFGPLTAGRRATIHEAADTIEALERSLAELVGRFNRRDWVLSGDDSKALHHARQSLARARSEHPSEGGR